MDRDQSHLSRIIFLSAFALALSMSTVQAAPPAPKPKAVSETSAVTTSSPSATPEEPLTATTPVDGPSAPMVPPEKTVDLKLETKSVYDFDRTWLAHVSLGVFNFLNLGLAYAPDSAFEYGVQGGWLGLTFGSYSATQWNVDALMRWHPFRGAFYVSTGLRYINIRFGFPPSALAVADPVGGTVINAAVARWEGLAVMGWRWIMGRFTIGFDFGVGIPFSYTGAVTVNSALSQNPLTAPQIQSLEQDGTAALQKYLGYVEPIVNFLKLGWKF